MIGKIEFNRINTQGANFQKAQSFKGISPQFFGPPGPQDKKMDLQLCQQLGIETQGLSRDETKASILSSLTGKPYDQMLNFYTNAGEQDMKMDMQQLGARGIEPSHQPNIMMARGENKSMIVNSWITEANGQNNIQGQQANGLQGGKKPQGARGGQKPQGPPPEILALLQQYGLQPTGSLEGDLAAIEKAQAEQAQNTNSTQPTDKSARPGDPNINALLDQYGVANTGSISGDLQALHQAMNVNNDPNTSQNFEALTGQPAPQTNNNSNITQLLEQYGLPSSGSPQDNLNMLYKVIMQSNMPR